MRTHARTRRAIALTLLLALPAVTPGEPRRSAGGAVEAARTARAWLASPRERRTLSAFAPAVRVELRVHDQPRPQRLWVVTIDLAATGVAFALTEPNPTSAPSGQSFETLCETTLEFARRRDVDLAVNTSAFGPLRARTGEPMDVAGLAAVEGRVFSTAVKDYGAMYVSRDGRVSLSAPPLESRGVWHVIPGFRMLIDDGRVVVDDADHATSFGGPNPRTAVGTDRAGRTLWLEVGAWDALNLDGGGSTTLVMRTAEGPHSVVNSPIHGGIPGNLRQVANNLGFVLPGRGPSQSDLSAVTGFRPD
jgi:hypothetical protein